MANMDDLLNDSLQSLEKGHTPDQVVKTLPPEAQELGDLVRLAARMRSMPHPVPARAARPAAQARSWQPAIQLPILSFRRLGTVGLLASMLLLVAFGVFLTGPVGADSAALADVNGQVEVRADSLSGWQVAAAGTRITSGQQVRTTDGSRAVLEFFDGSRIELLGGTQVAVSRLDGSWGPSLQLELQQQTGRTRHRVIPLRGAGSFYRVLTPSGEATVHGTNFEVDLQPAGKARFAVATGKVQVDYQGQQVFITSGQTTLAGPKAALSDPSYQFSVSGPVEFTGANEWTVTGVTFLVTEDTVRPAALTEGDLVVVTGHVDAENQRIADLIEIGEEPESEGTYLTGILEISEGDTWVIGDAPVLVTEDTVLAEGLEDGIAVKALIQVQEDGRWLALSIEPLDEETGEDPVQVTLTPPARPELVFQPEEIELTSCETTLSLPAALANLGEVGVDTASGIQLGTVVEDGGDMISSLVVSPSAWDTLPAGESASFNLQLALQPDWFEQVQKIKLRVNIAAEDHRDFYGSKLTFVLKSCLEEEEEEEEETPTATPTETETPEPEETETPDPDDICTGANPHPTGTRLAEEHGVTYEEIMAWFCERPANGFGEIDLAYNLAEKYELEVEEIFALRDQKLGWGQIKKQLAAAAEQEGTLTPDGLDKNGKKPEKTKTPPGLAKKTPKPPRR